MRLAAIIIVAVMLSACRSDDRLPAWDGPPPHEPPSWTNRVIEA